MKDGKTVGTGKTEVSKDGKSRTLETDGTLPDGKQYVFEKQSESRSEASDQR